MSRFRKFASVAVALVTMVSMTGVSSAQSVDINALLAQIAQLQALVAQLQAQQGGTPATSYTFTKNLTLGAKGDDVNALQQVLISGGYLKIAAPTGYFGPATQAALAAWQKANNITPAVGYFGPKTRAAMSSVATGGTTGGTVVIPSSAYLKVEAAGPAATTIPDGSLYNKVLKLKFMAGSQEEKVTGVTVTRGGFTANTNITGVSVWDDNGNRYGNIVTALTADGKATISFPGNPFMIPAGQTKYLTVAINLGTSANSGSVSFSVASVSDITVSSGSSQPSGAFPLAGAMFTTVDGSNSLADARIDDQSVAGLAYSGISAVDGNVEVGDTQKEVFKLRVVQNNSKEGINLEKVVFYVEGTIQEAKDVKNWKLYSPEGNVLATADAPIDRSVNFVLATPYLIDKGLTKDFSVKADIMDGSNNYFRVYVMNDYDVVVRGVTTGAAIQVTNSSGTSLTGADTQNTNGGFKIKQGALTVSKASGSASGSVAPSAQNVSLAKFDLKSAGEKLEIRKLGVQVEYTGLALTGTISVKDATTGETYLSISADTSNLQETSVTDPGAYQRDLSSYIVIDSGQTKTIEVTGTVSANATSSSSYKVSVGKFYTKRYSTNDYTDLATSEREANTISVSDVSLTVVKNTAFGNVNRAAGASNVKIAEFVFQASDADDIRVNSINFTIASSSYINNLKLMDGTTQLGDTIGTPSASSNTFTTNLTVTKSSSKVLSLYADVLSSALTDDKVIVSVGDAGVSGYGVLSGKSLSSTPSGAKEGQSVTIKSATLTIAADASTPLSKILLAGQTGVELSKIKFESANEDLTLKKLTLSLERASTTVWTSIDDISRNFSKVYLYDGSTLLNSGGTNVVSGNVVIDGLNFSLPAGTPKVLTVKADITDQETIKAKAVGRIIVKSSSTTDMKVSSSQGDLSTGITLISNAPSNYMLVTAAAPVIANAYTGTLTPAGSASEEVARFTISNPGTRDITLSSTTIAVSLTPNGATSTVNTWKIYEAGDLTNSLDDDSTSVSGTSPTSANITFDSFSPAQTISAGGSKTYVVRANTASACTKNSTFTGSCKLSIKINGSKGYSSTDLTSSPSGEELYWADGVVLYSYTTTGANGATFSNLLGSDSGEVLGPTLTY